MISDSVPVSVIVRTCSESDDSTEPAEPVKVFTVTSPEKDKIEYAFVKLYEAAPVVAQATSLILRLSFLPASL